MNKPDNVTSGSNFITKNSFIQYYIKIWIDVMLEQMIRIDDSHVGIQKNKKFILGILYHDLLDYTMSSKHSLKITILKKNYLKEILCKNDNTFLGVTDARFFNFLCRIQTAHKLYRIFLFFACSEIIKVL